MKSIILTILVIIFVSIIAFFAYAEVEKIAKQIAIGNCLQTGRITMQKDGQTITIPENYWYTYCMQQKGYK